MGFQSTLVWKLWKSRVLAARSSIELTKNRKLTIASRNARKTILHDSQSGISDVASSGHAIASGAKRLHSSRLVVTDLTASQLPDCWSRKRVVRPPQGSSGHVWYFCVVARCLSAESSGLKQRSRVQYQECRHQVCRNQHQRQLCHKSRCNSSVKIGSDQRDERPDTHGHGKVQNARDVPGHKALTRRKTGPA